MPDDENLIVCPFCNRKHQYPTGTLNEQRKCRCGAFWLVTPGLADEMPDTDDKSLEVSIVRDVGTFEDRDCPGFVEPTHAIFTRRRS